MIIKFTELPPRAKLLIFEYLQKNDVKKLARMSKECSLLAHVTLTKFWINSDKSKNWINLESTANHLEFEVFKKPNKVIRVDRRKPQILMEDGGFKRRSVKPQFLPANITSLAEYHKRISAGSLPVVSEQWPWGTMVCTSDFTHGLEQAFQEANEWEPILPEANELVDETSEGWIYFAVAFEGIVNENCFNERTLLGIPRSDIVGAISQSYDPKKAKHWLNPFCTLVDHYPDIYNDLSDFILKKASSIQHHHTLPKIQFSAKHKRPVTEITLSEEPTPELEDSNDSSDDPMLNSTLETETQQVDIAANFAKKRKMSELLSLYSEFTQKGGNRLCALITEELLHDEIMCSYGYEESICSYGN